MTGASETICDGGFALDVRFAPTRLRELSKMDGAVILSTDGSRIVRANVQLVPDPTIPTDESGTLTPFRRARRDPDRLSGHLGQPFDEHRDRVRRRRAARGCGLGDHPVAANQAIATLERYKARLDEVSRQLSTAEIEDFVTLRDVMTVVQRLEMVRRIGLEIDYDAVELGTDGRQLRLQLEELLGGNDTARELIVRDYHANPEPPSKTQVAATLAELDGLSDTELLDFTALSRVFGYPSTAGPGFGAQCARLPGDGRHPAPAVRPRRPAGPPVRLAAGLLAASATDLQSVEGASAPCGHGTSARVCRSWPSRRSPTGWCSAVSVSRRAQAAPHRPGPPAPGWCVGEGERHRRRT